MKSFLLIFLIGFTVQAKKQNAVNAPQFEEAEIRAYQQSLAPLSDHELISRCTAPLTSRLRYQSERTRDIESEINYHRGRNTLLLSSEERPFAHTRIVELERELVYSRNIEDKIQDDLNSLEVECDYKIRQFRRNKYEFPLEF